MQSFLLSLLLALPLFIQCGMTPSQSTNVSTAQQINSSPTQDPSANKSQENSSGNLSSESKCDFSAYAPTRKSHFIQAAAKKKIKPKYPSEDVRRGIQGQIQVKILVNDEGVVEKACATGGNESLRSAAEAASLQWKFKPNFGFGVDPSKTSGKKRYVEDFLLFNFVLNKKDAGLGITVTP